MNTHHQIGYPKYARHTTEGHHFTIYDFVKAHERFEDDEWDGDPADVIIDPPDGREGPHPAFRTAAGHHPN